MHQRVYTHIYSNWCLCLPIFAVPILLLKTVSFSRAKLCLLVVSLVLYCILYSWWVRKDETSRIKRRIEHASCFDNKLLAAHSHPLPPIVRYPCLEPSRETKLPRKQYWIWIGYWHVFNIPWCNLIFTNLSSPRLWFEACCLQLWYLFLQLLLAKCWFNPLHRTKLNHTIGN